jgi:hypothetical protein
MANRNKGQFSATWISLLVGWPTQTWSQAMQESMRAFSPPPKSSTAA